ALELVELLDAGDVVSGAIDVYPAPKKQTVIDFTPDWVNSFIGIDVSAEEQIKILEKLEFTVSDGKIYVPSFRSDVEHKADVSEEVARFYGYNNIPDRPLEGVADGGLTAEQRFDRLLHSYMTAMGFSEAQTYSFISPKAYDKLRIAKDSPLRDCVTIINPLGEDKSVMRTTALPTILEVASTNYNRRIADAAIYELATVYINRGLEELPDEREVLAAAAYGDGSDFFTVKGAFEGLLELLGIADYDVEAVTDDPTFHPGRTARYSKGGTTLGVVGEIHPTVCSNFAIGKSVCVIESDVAALRGLAAGETVYRPMPKYPAATRDLAVVLPRITPVLIVEKAIAAAVGQELEKIELFDIYQGEQISKDKKSVAYSLVLRSDKGTLTDSEADAAMERAIAAVKLLGGELRQ
ncbi:MAG: phenylalanine--tRNA ligase subunit beta, partial [Clostridia bacterium]|nr:phenylalanine--tRNA ligase subunit beta [Clostridia bacterium]